MKRTLSVIALAMTAGATFAEVPDIDSSGWAADPRPLGMTPAEYINGESRAFMADFLGRAGINQFHHFKGLTKAADKWVVSPNNDTIYSLAVVNARDGFTLELPDVGDRFLATQILTEDHMTPFYFYGGGTYSFTPEELQTDFVVVGVRMGTDGSDADVAYVSDELQPQYRIIGAAEDDDLPAVDMPTLEKVRAGLLAEYSKLPDSFGAMQKRVEDVQDWEFFTYVTAGAWGLSADENAMYAAGGPTDARGGACYTARFPVVPAKAFFSITVYGPEKYLMTDADNIVSSNRGVVANENGSFDVAFGDEKCRSLAPNFAATPEDGWSFLMRAYQPEVEAFKAYEMPAITPAE